MMSPALTLSGANHDRLAKHLFPGDGKEAAAILVCICTYKRRNNAVDIEVR